MPKIDITKYKIYIAISGIVLIYVAIYGLIENIMGTASKEEK
ncbi:MAG: hypothetical protein AB1567_05465 [bacterium]